MERSWDPQVVRRAREAFHHRSRHQQSSQSASTLLDRSAMQRIQAAQCMRDSALRELQSVRQELMQVQSELQVTKKALQAVRQENTALKASMRGERSAGAVAVSAGM